MRIKDKFFADRVFFTADLHLGHNNVIKYSNRPFKDSDDMDEKLIKAWNEVVPPNGIVFHAGDFSFHGGQHTAQLLSQLNGNVYLSLGNHDKLKYVHNAGFEAIADRFEIDVTHLDDEPDQRIIIDHYALLTWNKQHYKSWMLHGHSHGSLSETNLALRMDVGVDTHDYKPYSYFQVKKIMADKAFVPIDHHGLRSKDH
jgi:calcineurin-like phosphoesterase family protein